MGVRRASEAVVLTLMALVGAGLFVAAAVRVWDSQERVECKNRLRQLGIAVHNLDGQLRVLPRATIPNKGLAPDRRLSWLVSIGPYFEGTTFFRKIDPDKPWDAEENRFAALTHPYSPSYFQCPAYPEEVPVTTLVPTHYVGVAGVGKDAADLPEGDRKAGFFGNERTLRFKDVTDGAAATLMVAETRRAHGAWSAGGAATVRGLDPDGPVYIGQNGPFGSGHRGSSTNVLFGDGSVRAFAPSVSPRVLEALSTIAGGEAVEPPLGE